MGGMGRRRERAPEPGELPKGQQVRIHGLKSAATHNSKIARVTKYDPSKGRYTVELVGEDNSLSVKRENLQQIVSGCRLEGLTGSAQLNGQQCTIIGFDPAKKRYMVAVGSNPSTAKHMGVKTINVRLPTNTSVRVEGLQSAAAQSLNGTYGTVTSFDESSGRYVVKLKSGTKKLKPENVVA
mmetsp:Transcript_29949/g.44389  ORF Transcript_29949/g.44389 Transcript_29949/m.44389 type:complete len:182 (-) Transcript_29949:250-795(-)